MTEENQYTDLIRKIIADGTREESRNGPIRAIFGAQMRFSLEHGRMPILTTKKTAWKTCLKELLWFISGSTDNNVLHSKNVHIWDINASREYLDSAGLSHLEENDLGPIYGHQWRHFNAPYTTCHADYTGEGVDQLKYIIDALSTVEGRKSRRLVMSAWNPQQLAEMALPPCHVLVQFHVSNGTRLHCALYQRSGDVGLGVPFNIASYAFLTHLIAKHCGLEAYEFVHFIGNAHIYEDHVEALMLQCGREPFEFPTCTILERRECIDDYRVDDFVVENYVSHGPVEMKIW